MTVVELAALVARSMPGNRGRLSESTIAAKLGVTKCSPLTFVRLIEACADHGLLVGHLQRGGFGVIRSSTLEGAPPIDLEDA